MNTKPPDIWLLLDDRAGNRSQCLGVAEKLAMASIPKEIEYSRLAFLPNRILGASFLGVTRSCRKNLVAPWPDMVIAAGRRTAPVAREIKRRSNGKTKILQLMWPGAGGLDEFDLVCVPNHDGIGDYANVVKTAGAPSPITPEKIADLNKSFEADYETFSSPKIALLCGGSTKNRQFTREMAIELGRVASAMAQMSGGSLLVTTSRRTGDQAETLIEQIDAPSNIHRWNDPGDNPYLAYLACADVIIVTGDSMSMCSEACSTGKPVYIYAPSKLISDKHKRLHHELYELGCARPLSQKLEHWSYTPLNTAAQIAKCAAELLASVEA